ncbi:MAG: hypothetical protein ACI9GW_000769 [Halieaceae bacterium]|jgi:hypothetical protein
MSSRLIHLSLIVLMLVKPVLSLAGTVNTSDSPHASMEYNLQYDAQRTALPTVDLKDDAMHGDCHNAEAASQSTSKDCCDKMGMVQCLSCCATVTYAPTTMTIADTDLLHPVVQSSIYTQYLSQNLSSPFRPPRHS